MTLSGNTFWYATSDPVAIYLFKVNNGNIRTISEICSKLTIKIPERRRSGVFIVNLEQILHMFLVFRLLTLNSKCRLGISNGILHISYEINK